MGKKILLVDDNCSLRRTLSELLENRGHYVLDCSNGNDALEHVRDGNFVYDLSLIDNEPEEGKMDGNTLARELKILLPNKPVILFSAYDALPKFSNYDGLITKGTMNEFWKSLERWL